MPWGINDNFLVAKKDKIISKIPAIQVITIELVIGRPPMWAIFSAAKEISINSIDYYR